MGSRTAKGSGSVMALGSTVPVRAETASLRANRFPHPASTPAPAQTYGQPRGQHGPSPGPGRGQCQVLSPSFMPGHLLRRGADAVRARA